MDKCKECGCACKQCNQNEQKLSDIHLHKEIESLRQKLCEQDSHIVTMETHFLNEAERFPNGELASLKEEISIWLDKYERLNEAHKRVQRINQNLEDKLLKIVDKCETEKGAFSKDIATLSHRLAEANYTIHRLTQDNENYRNDVSLAIQLLQNKPENFIGQKFDNLPSEYKLKVKSYATTKSNNNEGPSSHIKSITVPISTFPPTAMVYNVTKSLVEKQEISSDEESKPPVDIVSAAIMAKILEDREKERIFTKHCNTCTCYRSVLKIDSEVQVEMIENGTNSNKNSKNNNSIPNESFTFELPGSQNLNHPIKSQESQSTSVKEYNSKFYNRSDIGRSTTENSLMYMDKYERKSSKDLQNLKSITKETADKSNRGSKSSDSSINVINDRVWRNTYNNDRNNFETIIDMKNVDNFKSQNENSTFLNYSGFGTDVISSSDPSSISSVVTSPVRSEKNTFDDTNKISGVNNNNNNNKSSSRSERISGPRNCLMRVTPGSKNILLDSVGAFETVLYTSSSNKPNTALVHVRKSSARSVSVSSDENPTSSTQDSNHLSRVAEWIKCSNDSDSSNLISIDSVESGSGVEMEKSQESEVPLQSQNDSDLIMFETSSDDENKGNRDMDGKAFKVRITKEMENAYLKLTHSLDATHKEGMQSTIELLRNEANRGHKAHTKLKS